MAGSHPHIYESEQVSPADCTSPRSCTL